MKAFGIETKKQDVRDIYENLGKDIIQGMVPSGNGKYAGSVWRPSNGKIYVGKLVLSGDTLKMKGCIAGGLICSSQNWSRLP